MSQVSRPLLNLSAFALILSLPLGAPAKVVCDDLKTAMNVADDVCEKRASVPNQRLGDKDSGRGARIARREE